jgi:tRNA modification GTPase
MTDTIYAPATAPGRSAVAVVRLSGAQTSNALRQLIGTLPEPRRASLRRLRDPASGAVLDDGLVLWFPGPASYTGEDSAELHLHGGMAVVEGVLDGLDQLGLRMAEPGEFTRRAFQNQRMDLAQAEAVADLVDAETAAQRQQALDQLAGGLSQRYGGWRDQLLGALAMLEAGIDFPDEEVPEVVANMARPPLERLLLEVRLALDDGKRGERIRDGYRVAVIGAPNAGKSSLINGLLGRDAAIVTDIAGTTRDIIEAPLVLAGFKLLIADTAGIRQSDDPIEKEGVRRAQAWAQDAALRLWLVDGAATSGDWALAKDLVGPGDVCLINKSDLGPSADGVAAEAWARARGLAVQFLSLSRDGADTVRFDLTERVTAALSGADFPAATRRRHAVHLFEAAGHIERALGVLALGSELAAEDVRLAARALERVTGKIDPEDVLGAVFSTFCIGK